ncbi:MAG: hypothetical protein MIK35_03715, partial [Bacillus amyloliquefaciens]
ALGVPHWYCNDSGVTYERFTLLCITSAFFRSSSDSITKSIIDLMIFCVFVTPCIILSQRDEPGRPWRSKVGGSNTLLTYLFFSGHHPLVTFKKGI